MIDKVADLQHQIWIHWMIHIFEVGVLNDDGSLTIPVDKVERWKRQMNTEYGKLPEDEKQSDMEQALKILSVLKSPIGDQ